MPNKKLKRKKSDNLRIVTIALLVIGGLVVLMFALNFLGQSSTKAGTADFVYPPEWGGLTFEYSADGTERYVPENKIIASVAYHRPSDTITFVRNTGEVEYFEGIEGPGSAKQALYLLADGEEIELYDKDTHLGRILIGPYSPQGRYLLIRVALTGQFDAKIFDLVETREILASIASETGNYYAGGLRPRHILWTEDENILVINYYDFEVGPASLVVSDYGNPAQPNLIINWDTVTPPLPDRLSLDGIPQLTIRNVSITADGIVQFSAEACERCFQDKDINILHQGDYKYEVRTKQLERVSR